MSGWMDYKGLQLPSRTPRSTAGKKLRDDLMVLADQMTDWGAGAPSNFEADAASGTQIQLTWTDNSNFETAFVIDRSTSSSGPWTTIATTSVNATSYLDGGLNSGTTYYYRLRGKFGPFFSDPLVASAIPEPMAPGAPTGLMAVTVSLSQINLSWTAPASNGGSAITGYKIERESPVGGGWSTLVGNTGSTATTYNNTGLSSNTQYNYRVSAINAIGTGTASTAANATTTLYPTPLFNYPFATNANDISGNGNNATLVGSATINSGSLLLNGGYAAVPVGIAGIGPAWTASCMFMTDSSVSNGGLIGQLKTGSSGADAAMWLQYGGGGTVAVGADGDLQGWYGSGLDDEEWHHVVGRLDGSGVVSLWIDGVQAYDSGATTYANVSGSNPRIGSFQGTGEDFIGRIKKAKGWQLALTDVEIANLYASDTAP